ncbi:hypothetical protein HAX54_037011, partial [Datura stramonium]|nr:hypothetical protein [Datura stramonium]
MGQEVKNEDASMPQQPPQCYELRWVTKKQQIDEEVVNYRPWYDPNGLDVTKKKEPK